MNRRMSYRVVYPTAERPRLIMDIPSATGAPVVECSEGGLSFEAPGAWPRMKPGAELCARLEFHGVHRERWSIEDASFTVTPNVSVTGEVVRVLHRVVAVRLEWPGVPFGVLLREQFALRARYPGWPAHTSDVTRAMWWSLQLER